MSIWKQKPELIARLRSMWGDGKTAGQIAIDLGNDISRNSVISMVNRLRRKGDKFEERTVPDAHNRRPFVMPSMGGTPSKNKTKAAPFVVPEATLEPFRLDGQLITPETMTAYGMCKYPHGEPTEPGFHYCGHGQKDKSPYCTVHHSRCFAAPTGKSNVDKTVTRNSGILRALG